MHKDAKIHILAAMCAVTNMGQAMPSAEQISFAIKGKRSSNVSSLSSTVIYFAEQYMETDEHQDIFEADARSFIKDLRNDEAKGLQTWPDIYKRYEEAEALADK
jgi:hypothetical protein